MDRGWILVTGCSSGIGRALVAELRGRGWCVVATARNREVLADLPSGPDLRLLSLDVTDSASLAAAAATCADLRLVGLVNNAGYGQMGPLELLRPEELRAQFETNVIGLQACTNAFLPLLRAGARPGEGRIVQVASVLGRLSIPMAGAYNASKHAVVALAETLRLEVGREIAVSALREWMAELGQRATVKVATIGKVKTVAQMVALACLLYAVNPRHQLQPGTDTWMGQFVFHVGDWLLAAAAVLTLWSGFQYLHAAWPALRADEQAAAGRTQKNRGVNG